MISIIAAIDEKRGIGKNGQLPWHIPEDLKRFKDLTTKHPVIMGSRTFRSIGKLLPDRTNIVITRDVFSFKSNFPFVEEVASSLENAIEKAKKSSGSEEIFIVGGGQVFNKAIEIADKLYLTKVKGDFKADTFFPDYSSFKNENFIGAGEENEIKYSFIELTKV